MKVSYEMSGFRERTRLCIDSFYDQYSKIENIGDQGLLHQYMMESKRVFPSSLTCLDLSRNEASGFFIKWNDVLRGNRLQGE